MLMQEEDPNDSVKKDLTKLQLFIMAMDEGKEGNRKEWKREGTNPAAPSQWLVWKQMEFPRAGEWTNNNLQGAAHLTARTLKEGVCHIRTAQWQQRHTAPFKLMSSPQLGYFLLSGHLKVEPFFSFCLKELLICSKKIDLKKHTFLPLVKAHQTP